MICKIDGCGNKVRSKLLCIKHINEIKGKICKIDGCVNPVAYNEMCPKHNMHIKRHGKIIRTRFDKNEIIIRENYAELIILNNKNIIVAIGIIDLDDVDRVSKYRWGLTPNGYIFNRRTTKQHQLGRFILDINDSNMVCDHVNRNKLDNRKQNLRIATIRLNRFNTCISIHNKSGKTGVCWAKGKWEAYIYNIKRYRLGRFTDKEEAIRVRREAELKLYGEYSPN